MRFSPVMQIVGDFMTVLFYDQDGIPYDSDYLLKILHDIGADDSETLFIHSDIAFGRPSAGFKRKDYLKALYEAIIALNVENIIVPTFTYSFCNHEDYDVLNSRTSMGAFSEFIRQQDGRYRTLDPLLSFSVPAALKHKFENISNHSLGKGSGFDILHSMNNVKFLFFGAKQGECFTYLHYIEKMLDVPYRYDQEFTGKLIDYDGKSKTVTQAIHTHCYGVKIPNSYDYFENELLERKLIKKVKLGNSMVSCIDKDIAYEQITEKINNNPYYFTNGQYTAEDLIHKYGFGENGERVTHC